MKQHNYFTYMVTNHTKTVLYTGVTNDIKRRLNEHFENRGKAQKFAGRYHCYLLVYYERFSHIAEAIAREKEIKDWKRVKKNALINSFNPTWKILNEEVA
jgi:putative endonuclease